MNFEDILNIAAQKQKKAEKELSTTKRYSTAAKPAKKIIKPKPKSVQSAAIRALMEKKHEEEKKRATEAKKRMDEAQDVLNKKRKKTDIVKSLASANTSSKTEKPQDKKTKEEKYESKEHKAKHMQFMQKVSKLKTPREDVEKKQTDFKRPPDRPIPKKKAPPPPSKPMSFQDLMKMAEKKKDEPVPLPKIHEELFGADSDDEEVEEIEKEEPRYVYHSKGRYLDTKGSEPGSSSVKSKSRHQIQNDKSRGSGSKSKSSNDTHKSSSTSKSDASKRPSSSTHNGTNKSATPSKQVVHPNNRRGEVQDSKSRSVSGSASKPKCTLVVESLPSRLTTGPPRQPPPRRGYEDMRRGMKRRYDDSEEESDDFIDDSNEDVDYSKYIREIFGYDKRKYRYESDREIASMESNFRQVMQEEARSARLAIQEDADELRKAAEEEKRKQPRSKGKQRK